jgi:hypothetical protein
MPKLRELNDLMDIDHVIRVTRQHVAVSAEPGVWAPEVFCFLDDDGVSISRQEDADMVARCESQGWDVMNGYSSQYLYAGPIMHSSESVGGQLEKDILERPGLYVVCVVECLGPDRDANENPAPAGWVILRKLDPA